MNARMLKVLTAAAVVAAPATSACNRGTAEGATSAAPEFAAVERRDMDIRAEASGLIEPIKLVEVKSKASGEVLRIHVETGDEVERGALLAEVDPRDVKNAYDQAEADREVAVARLETSEAQLARIQELRAARVATEQELESAKLDEANSRAQKVRAKKPRSSSRRSGSTTNTPGTAVAVKINSVPRLSAPPRRSGRPSSALPAFRSRSPASGSTAG